MSHGPLVDRNLISGLRSFMNCNEFAALPLHDATLESMTVDWEQGACRLYLSLFATPGKSAKPHCLEFRDLSQLHMPRMAPWGFSRSINSASWNGGTFLVEMQSGDVIEITANAFTCTAL